MFIVFLITIIARLFQQKGYCLKVLEQWVGKGVNYPKKVNQFFIKPLPRWDPWTLFILFTWINQVPKMCNLISSSHSISEHLQYLRPQITTVLYLYPLMEAVGRQWSLLQSTAPCASTASACKKTVEKKNKTQQQKTKDHLFCFIYLCTSEYLFFCTGFIIQTNIIVWLCYLLANMSAKVFCLILHSLSAIVFSRCELISVMSPFGLFPHSNCMFFMPLCRWQLWLEALSFQLSHFALYLSPTLTLNQGWPI